MEKENTIKAKINGNIYTLELAETDVTQSKGLSNRPSMPKNRGMLFKFKQNSIHTFWMKQMNFPLDFIWLQDSEVKDISKNIPPPEGDQPENIQIVTPRFPVNSVIELNAGIIDEIGLKIGDKIEYIN